MLSRRILSFFVFMAIFSAVFTIGAEIQVSEEESAIILDELETVIEEIDGLGIFVHNTLLALPMFIPGFGIAWGSFASFSTGMVFSVLKDVNPMLDNIPALTVIFMTPFGLMEIAAYSIAMSRSFILVHKIVKKISIRQDIRVVGIEIAILIGLLLAGGFIEYYLIQNIPADVQV